MKLISLQLNNYKNFYGCSNIIHFATEEVDNVTVIMGGSGSGKTNIIQSILWLLYGESGISYSEVHIPIINIKSLSGLRADSVNCSWVVLTFEWQGKRYMAKRNQLFIKSDSGACYVGNSILDLYMHIRRDHWEMIDNASEEVEKIFPYELHKLFFVDSERLEEFNSVMSSEYIDKLNKINGENTLLLTINHVVEKMRNSLKIMSIDNDIFSRVDVFSRGERSTLGILFIVTLIGLMKTNDIANSDCVYPLFLDSPFMLTDNQLSQQLLSILTTAARQVILTTHEPGLRIENDIKIPKAYMLNNNEDQFMTKIISI